MLWYRVIGSDGHGEQRKVPLDGWDEMVGDLCVCVCLFVD